MLSNSFYSQCFQTVPFLNAIKLFLFQMLSNCFFSKCFQFFSFQMLSNCFFSKCYQTASFPNAFKLFLFQMFSNCSFAKCYQTVSFPNAIKLFLFQMYKLYICHHQFLEFWRYEIKSKVHFTIQFNSIQFKQTLLGYNDYTHMYSAVNSLFSDTKKKSTDSRKNKNRKKTRAYL